MFIATYLPYSVVGGCVATIVAVIVGVSAALKRSDWTETRRRMAVRITAAVLIGWFVIAAVLAALGVYRGVPGEIPTIQFGIVIPIVVGCLIIWRSAAFLRLVDAVPRSWVIAVQFYRMEGVIFLILYASNLLPGMFALPAGVGDMATGLAALAIGLTSSQRHPVPYRSALLWNLFGIADLVVALTTGLLTSPSPLQMFAFDHPNELISAFPLVLIPTFLVPLAILLHIISLIQLGRATARTDSGRAHAVTQTQV